MCPPHPALCPALPRSAMMSFVGLGSVSDWVTHHAECPIVILRA